jgi:hypothetical protein
LSGAHFESVEEGISLDQEHLSIITKEYWAKIWLGTGNGWATSDVAQWFAKQLSHDRHPRAEHTNAITYNTSHAWNQATEYSSCSRARRAS